MEDNQKIFPTLISVLAEQDYDGNDPERMELLTEGTLEVKEDCLILRYEESKLTGMEGTTTIFEIYDKKIILQRVGTVSSLLVFEEGCQYTSLYETPFGELCIDIQTSYLHHTLTEHGGSIEIHYSISIEHASTGNSRFKMRVRRT